MGEFMDVVCPFLFQVEDVRDVPGWQYLGRQTLVDRLTITRAWWLGHGVGTGRQAQPEMMLISDNRLDVLRRVFSLVGATWSHLTVSRAEQRSGGSVAFWGWMRAQPHFGRYSGFASA